MISISNKYYATLNYNFLSECDPVTHFVTFFKNLFPNFKFYVTVFSSPFPVSPFCSSSHFLIFFRNRILKMLPKVLTIVVIKITSFSIAEIQNNSDYFKLEEIYISKVDR